MLFPSEREYRDWMHAAGFQDIEVAYVRPDWHAGERYGLSIAGRKPVPGASPAAAQPRESVEERMTARRWARWVAGSAAGAVFVPIAAAASLIRKGRRWAS
jgi:MPBQ/MSBQ methyltransferase